MSLAPAHLADLRASGLTDETIAALHIESLRPADIPVHQAESAYRLPYHDLDGSQNCFARVKLVPSVVDHKGHTQKYWQPAGTQPGLYFSPTFFNWQTVARTAGSEIVIAEGEKKAAAGCQAGLFTVGVGGVWSWRTTIANGERLVLPAFDAFQWTTRPVLISPDSDAWHKGKEFKILAGFFALAKELESRGASVEFVVLPDASGHKCGLDDWLLIAGNDAEYSWPKLERRRLDDSDFASLTAWWQGWKEKQTTQTALRERQAEQLEHTEVAGLHTVTSATHSVRFLFDQLHTQRNSIMAELTITVGGTEVLSLKDIGLKNNKGQTEIANGLEKITGKIPWKVLFPKACSMVLVRHREGDPLRRLTVETPIPSLTYQINPFVFQNKPTVLYGDGGLGKSSLALLCAMLCSMGETVAGIRALKGNTLYLDYEDSYDVHVRRMQAIAACHPCLARAEVRYQFCNEPLPTLTHTLLRRIQSEEITFLVLDSLAAATGGDAGPEAASKIFRAIRTLNVGTFILAHVSKTPSDGQEHPTVYGSVFNQNFPRGTWELRKQQDVGEEVVELGLYNWKSNLVRQHTSFGLRVTYNAESTKIGYEQSDLSKTPELAQGLPAWARIRTLLEDGHERTTKEVSEDLDLKLSTAKSELSRGAKRRKWMKIQGDDHRIPKWTVLVAK